MTIGLCISLYLWAVMLRVGGSVAVGHSGGCGCLAVADVVVLVITSPCMRAPRFSCVSGDTRGTDSLSRSF